MNQYFVVQITKTSDSEAYATLVTPKATETEARMLYHQTLASVYANDNIEYAQVYVDDFVGNKILLETILPEADDE
jgi:hypothetical protein